MHIYIAKSYEMQFRSFKGKRRGESSKQSHSWALMLSGTIRTVGGGTGWFGGLNKIACEVRIFLSKSR